MLDTTSLDLEHVKGFSKDFSAIVGRAVAEAKAREYFVGPEVESDESLIRLGSQEEIVRWLEDDLPCRVQIAKKVIAFNLAQSHDTQSIDGRYFAKITCEDNFDAAGILTALAAGYSAGKPLARSDRLRNLAREVVQKYQPDQDIEAWATGLIQSVGKVAD